VRTALFAPVRRQRRGLHKRLLQEQPEAPPCDAGDFGAPSGNGDPRARERRSGDAAAIGPCSAAPVADALRRTGARLRASVLTGRTHRCAGEPARLPTVAQARRRWQRAHAARLTATRPGSRPARHARRRSAPDIGVRRGGYGSRGSRQRSAGSDTRCAAQWKARGTGTATARGRPASADDRVAKEASQTQSARSGGSGGYRSSRGPAPTDDRPWGCAKHRRGRGAAGRA
jgi:hypothetical protein